MLSWALMLALPLGTGLLAGGIFFATLWWTVRHCLFLRRPAFWFICSLILRMGACLACFHFLLTRDVWGREMLVAGLLGFMLARTLAIRFAGGFSLKDDPDPLVR